MHANMTACDENLDSIMEDASSPKAIPVYWGDLQRQTSQHRKRQKISVVELETKFDSGSKSKMVESPKSFSRIRIHINILSHQTVKNLMEYQDDEDVLHSLMIDIEPSIVSLQKNIEWTKIHLDGIFLPERYLSWLGEVPRYWAGPLGPDEFQTYLLNLQRELNDPTDSIHLLAIGHRVERPPLIDVAWSNGDWQQQEELKRHRGRVLGDEIGARLRYPRSKCTGFILVPRFNKIPKKGSLTQYHKRGTEDQGYNSSNRISRVAIPTKKRAASVFHETFI